MKYFLLTIAITFLNGCFTYDPPLGVLTILNYSDSAIYVYSTCSDSIELSPKLNLFGIWPGNGVDENGQKKEPLYSPNYRINAYSYGNINVNGTVKKPCLSCEDKKLRLFFIKEHTMRTKSWEEICKAQSYANSMVLTENQLDSLKWKITYKPH